MTHRVSLCICTMNRPEDLKKCLASVERSLARPHEVLVSDDSRDEAIQRANREVVGGFAGAAYLAGPKRGLSANRNNCLRLISGDLVVFVDDDVMLHPEFLKRGPEEYDRLRALHGTGRIIVTGYEIQPGFRAVPSNLSFLGFYTGKVPDTGEPDAICINSTLFPAELFTRARFDENILYGTEERDMSIHAAHLGYRTLYSPDLCNYHYPSPVNRGLYNRSMFVSRFYFGFKRYWLYGRSPVKFALFNVYALANAIGNRLKAARFSESLLVVGAFFEAWRLFVSKLRENARNP